MHGSVMPLRTILSMRGESGPPKTFRSYTEESEVSNAVCAEPTLSQDLQAVSCPFKAPTSLERRHYARVSSLSACNRIDPELGML